jgi:small subunit ribosomal protein S16
MAVRIRLSRFGKKGQPRYRIAVADSKFKRDGKVIEYIGAYNPMVEPPDIKIDKERYDYWLSVGAKPSATVKSIAKKVMGNE